MSAWQVRPCSAVYCSSHHSGILKWNRSRPRNRGIRGCWLLYLNTSQVTRPVTKTSSRVRSTPYSRMLSEHAPRPTAPGCCSWPPKPERIVVARLRRRSLGFKLEGDRRRYGPQFATYLDQAGKAVLSVEAALAPHRRRAPRTAARPRRALSRPRMRAADNAALLAC
jgi:hypothetical protein